ncbi:N(2)-fixation sustaining protein CowN [Rhodovulum sulfidophilum]|nr:N(2)-fixation sustaining protein CowN [Rhodovulum sulfidophilum]ANB36203.1 nitrogen fixation protein CowN [Rhodovulum sulfidophilum DSM 1374]ANB40009.1 nitrogen fixation protein CowN [Rhodovulum sulfidophilum]MBK5923434.1 nitrogen fixation protein CowN [Rhodovulum sulfidophilum]MBL3550597.1 N(2)-fixation sustaining protein CowN [Rhodovulum sulfidophilum]MBL3560527.1 N(2)-fixation sustaining protein CowN [Rhodovulum sulfidophilum]
MTDQTPDRYVSFCGIECDRKADRLMAMLAAHMAESQSRWVGYFEQKLAEKARMGNDNLHFVGSQVNSLSAFFEELGDSAAEDLLYDLEQTCC